MQAKIRDLIITNLLAIVLGIVSSGIMLLFLGENRLVLLLF